MPLSSTMTPIATNTLTAAAYTVTFSSIPQTYTDLVLIVNATTTANSKNPVFRFNSDSGTNYSDTQLSGNGSTTSSGRDTNASGIYAGVVGISGGNESTIICNIQNYANTTTNKSALIRTSSPFNSVYTTVGLWRSTAAITSIDILTLSSGQNWSIGSSFTLYGIKAA
jgi:hypothetical protein